MENKHSNNGKTKITMERAKRVVYLINGEGYGGFAERIWVTHPWLDESLSQRVESESGAGGASGGGCAGFLEHHHVPAC